MESKVLVISPEATIKIIQDWYRGAEGTPREPHGGSYRTQHPTEKYVVMIVRIDNEDPMDDKTYIAKSMLDLYHKLMIEFEVEKFFKQEIERDKAYIISINVKPSDLFRSFDNEETPGQFRGGGRYLPYLFFATQEDLDHFIQVAQAEVAKIIDKLLI